MAFLHRIDNQPHRAALNLNIDLNESCANCDKFHALSLDLATPSRGQRDHPKSCHLEKRSHVYGCNLVPSHRINHVHMQGTNRSTDLHAASNS